MFRGGGAWLTSPRSNEVFTDVFGFTGTTNDNTEGWYAGGALNLILSKDTWGMMSGVWTQGEIGVEYKRWTSNEVIVAVPATCAVAITNASPRNSLSCWFCQHSSKSRAHHADRQYFAKVDVHGRQSISSLDHSGGIRFSCD